LKDEKEEAAEKITRAKDKMDEELKSIKDQAEKDIA
jgi:hypothetical protein